ncbi:MAG: YfaZ family outer membrane protein [Steroidobacteraceae bacterium]
MRKFSFLLGMLTLGMGGVASAASSLDLGLSNELAMATYQMDFNSDVRLQGSLLHADVDDQRSNVLSVGFLVGQNTGNVQPYVGAKVVALDGEHANAYGLALDGGIDFNVAPRLWLGASAAYSPNVVLGGDFDTYYELGARVGYQIIPQAQAYLGFKDVQAKKDSFHYEAYQGVVVGVKFSF